MEGCERVEEMHDMWQVKAYLSQNNERLRSCFHSLFPSQDFETKTYVLIVYYSGLDVGI